MTPIGNRLTRWWTTMIHTLKTQFRWTDDRGISPVIGVILLVAITVILATVAGAFVLSIGDSVEEDAQAGVSIDNDRGAGEIAVEVTSIGTGDHVNITGDVRDETATDSDDFYVDSDGDELAWDEGPDEELSELGVGDVVTIGDKYADGVDVRLGDGAPEESTVTATAAIEADDVETQVRSEEYTLDGSGGNQISLTGDNLSVTFENASGQGDGPDSLNEGEVYIAEFTVENLDESIDANEVNINDENSPYQENWNRQQVDNYGEGASFYLVFGEDVDGDNPVHSADRVAEDDLNIEPGAEYEDFTTNDVKSGHDIRVVDITGGIETLDTFQIPEDL